MTNLPRNDDGSLQAYAWPGGYTIYYLCQNGDVLCADCANAQEKYNARQQMTALVDGNVPWLLNSEILIGADANYEDCQMYCANCNKQVEPSYSDCSEENDVS